MPRIVRRFFSDAECQVESEAHNSLYSAEMVLTDEGVFVNGTMQISKRKRHEEVFGYVNGAFFRASSEEEKNSFQKHWNRDRV